MQAIARIHQRWGTWARTLGPYVVLEILLPGGTLFALLLFLYRRVRSSHVAHVSKVAWRAAAAVAVVHDERIDCAAAFALRGTLSQIRSNALSNC